MSPHLIRYLILIKKLQSLIASGQGESRDADTLRDQMDEPWSHLTPEEIATFPTSIRNMKPEASSEGLYHICVGMGADPAAVAGWPDHRRKSFIDNGY